MISSSSNTLQFSLGRSLGGSNLAEEMMSLLDSTFSSSFIMSSTDSGILPPSTSIPSPESSTVSAIEQPELKVPKRKSSIHHNRRQKTSVVSINTSPTLLGSPASSAGGRKTGSTITLSPGPPPAFALPPTPEGLKSDKLDLPLFLGDTDLYSSGIQISMECSRPSGNSSVVEMTPPATPAKSPFADLSRNSSSMDSSVSRPSETRSIHSRTSSFASSAKLTSTTPQLMVPPTPAPPIPITQKQSPPRPTVLTRSSSLSARKASNNNVRSPDPQSARALTRTPSTRTVGRTPRTPTSSSMPFSILSPVTSFFSFDLFKSAKLSIHRRIDSPRQQKHPVVKKPRPDNHKPTTFMFQASWIELQIPIRTYRGPSSLSRPSIITFCIPPPPQSRPPPKRRVTLSYIKKELNGPHEPNPSVSPTLHELSMTFDTESKSESVCPGLPPKKTDESVLNRSLPPIPPPSRKDDLYPDSASLAQQLLPDPPFKQPFPFLLSPPSDKPHSEERIRQMGIFELEPRPRREGRKGSLAPPKSPFMSSRSLPGKSPSLRSVSIRGRSVSPSRSPPRKSIDAMSTRSTKTHNTIETNDSEYEEGMLTVDTGVPLIPVTSFLTPAHEPPPPLPPKDGVAFHISEPILVSTSSHVPIVPIPEVLSDLRRMGRLPITHDPEASVGQKWLLSRFL